MFIIIFALTGFGLLFFGIYYLKVPFSMNRFTVDLAYILKYSVIVFSVLIIAIAALALRWHNFYVFASGLLVNFAIMACSIIIGFIVINFIAVKLITKNGVPQWGQSDEILNHSFIPEAHSTMISNEYHSDLNINSSGLRGKNINEKASGTIRLLMLGDSFTFGLGVSDDDTFSRILEKKFEAKGEKVEVINAGVDSYSPLLEYLFLTTRGLALKPDLVILNFDMSDLTDDRNYEELAVFKDGEVQAVPASRQKTELNPFKRINQSTPLLNMLKSAGDVLYAKIFYKPEVSGEQISDPRVNRIAITRNDFDHKKYYEYWQRSFRYILKIRDLCEKNKIKFVLSTYPYGHQISTQEWKLGRHLFGFGDDIIYSDKPFTILSNFAANNQLIFFNVLEYFKKQSQERLYFPYDGHMNPRGHGVYAEAIYNNLLKNKLLPK